MAGFSTGTRRWILIVSITLFGPFRHVRLVLAGNKLQRLRKKYTKVSDLKVLENNVPLSLLPNTRKLQFTQDEVDHFHPGQPSAAYVKCNDLLDQSAGNDSQLNESEFVYFLSLLTNGEITSTSFDDLDDKFTTAFYRAACSSGPQCDGGNGSIVIGGSVEAVEIVAKFCERVMSYVKTSAKLSFGYSIRYDTDAIAKDALPGCLEKATENLLRDNFGCEVVVTAASQQRRLPGLRGERRREQSPFRKASNEEISEEQRMFAELLMREREDMRFLTTGMSMEDPSCSYEIDVQVPSIFNLGCIPAVPQGSNLDCGLVRSIVEVAAPQSLQPYADDLRQNVTNALRSAIDGDTFEEFFPQECLLQRRLL